MARLRGEMGFWLLVLAGDGALGGYLAWLWAHGHAAIFQGPPGGLHGRGVLVYLAVVVLLAAVTPWELLDGRRLSVKAALVLGCLAAALVDLYVLSDPQQQVAEWATVLGLYNGAFGYPVVWFYVLGPLLEWRSGARSPEGVR
jgi:hypothetical protein